MGTASGNELRLLSYSGERCGGDSASFARNAGPSVHVGHCDASIARQPDPIAAYQEFLAAIERRDLDAVLARVADQYGLGLRMMRDHARFAEFFGLWCERFPPHISTSACSYDADTAILQTNNEGDQSPVQAWVRLVRRRGEWLVISERCENGCTRVPTHFVPVAS